MVLEVHRLSMQWREISSNWVLIPPRPVAVIHFLGGAFVAAAPQITYCRLLESLARQGYAIVATPFVNTFDHHAIAQEVLYAFDRALDYLWDTALRKRSLPIYGMGHSMGCKLHLLIGSSFAVERAGNILMSFNNFPARKAIPFGEPLTTALDVEFSPTPAETMYLIAKNYQIRRNLLVNFTNDNIDQTPMLKNALETQFPGMVVAQVLAGNHLTPLGPDLNWQAGATFSPLDALSQWLRQGIYQGVYRELHQLEKTVLLWLNPFYNPEC
jgi:hypothetical protein